MFRKKKSSAGPAAQPQLRGRAASRTGADRSVPNPLARRLQADDEPPTIDLVGSGAPPSGSFATDDSKTVSLQTEISDLARVISCDQETGKFYIHPGSEDVLVTLGGEPVRAPTELRRGDTIRIGDTDIHFAPRG